METGATLLCGDEVAAGGINRNGSAVNPPSVVVLIISTSLITEMDSLELV